MKHNEKYNESMPTNENSKKNTNKVYVVLGLTGTGKTNAIAQLDTQHYEIISCDSRQLYKGLEIATAAPSPELQEKLSHHLVSILAPHKKFSAGRFVRLTQRILRQIIHDRKKIPILVGGSGFYYRALKNGMFPVTTPPQIRQQVATLSSEERLTQLRQIDPQALCQANEAANKGRIHPNDDYRITRALEVNLASGKNWLHIWQQAHIPSASEFDFQGVWLDYTDLSQYRAGLYERAKAMQAAGIVSEAGRIYEKYGACTGLATIGCDLALQVYLGKTKAKHLAEGLAQAHWRYAKRQRIWLRKEKGLQRIVSPALVCHSLYRK